MKSKKLLLGLSFMLFFSCFSNLNAQQVKSSVQLMDGTRWKPNGTLLNGTYCFKYAGTNGIVIPNTQYTELLIAADYSMIQVNFVFGMPGMYQQMYTWYSYLGEGTQPAYDYINGGGFN